MTVGQMKELLEQVDDALPVVKTTIADGRSCYAQVAVSLVALNAELARGPQDAVQGFAVLIMDAGVH